MTQNTSLDIFLEWKTKQAVRRILSEVEQAVTGAVDADFTLPTDVVSLDARAVLKSEFNRMAEHWIEDRLSEARETVALSLLDIADELCGKAMPENEGPDAQPEETAVESVGEDAADFSPPANSAHLGTTSDSQNAPVGQHTDHSADRSSRKPKRKSKSNLRGGLNQAKDKQSVKCITSFRDLLSFARKIGFSELSCGKEYVMANAAGQKVSLPRPHGGSGDQLGKGIALKLSKTLHSLQQAQ